MVYYPLVNPLSTRDIMNTDAIITTVTAPLPYAEVWFILAIIFFFAGVTKGGLGNGIGWLAIIFLSLFINPLLAISLILPVFIMCDVMSLVTWWKKWNLAKTLWAYKWALVGIVLGTFLLYPMQQGMLSTDVIKFFLGLLGVYITGRWLFKTKIKKQAPTTLSLNSQRFLCITGGSISTMLNSGGMPLMLYALNLGLKSETTHAITVLLFTMINITKLVPYVGLGLLNYDIVILALSFFPVTLLGVLFGKFLHYRMSNQMFNTIAYAGAGLSSVKLLWDIFFPS